MKAMKKTLAILLCLVMCLSMLPTWVLAEAPETEAPEIDAALMSEEPVADVMQEPISEETPEVPSEEQPEDAPEETAEVPAEEPSEAAPAEASLQEVIPEAEEQAGEEPEPEYEPVLEPVAISDEENGESGTEGNDASPVEEPAEIQPNTVTTPEEAGEVPEESGENPAETEIAADPAAENPDAAEAITVTFRIAPENAELAVYTRDNPEHPEEKTVLTPEEDGSYRLIPGEYSYTLTAEGYVTVEEEPLLVVPSEEPVKIEAVMTPADGQTLGAQTEAEPEEAVLQAEEAEVEASNEAIVPADTAKDETVMLMASSGTCGDNLTWSLDAGTLTISGTGMMTDYSQETNATAPWGFDIKKVIIKAGVTSIGSWAFYRCRSLTDVAIPNTVTSIRSYAFEGCSVLTGIEIPGSVTSIGSAAFDNCKGITELRIPQSVTSIGSAAFSQCTSLRTVEFMGNPGDVKSNIFSKCNSMERIKMPILGTKLYSLFSGNIESVPATLKTVEIIESTTIPSGYFPSGSGITSIKLPNTLKSIGTYAFAGCHGLSSLTIPYGVTSIGDGAFLNCSSLSKLTIPKSVTTIGTMNGGEIFSGCTELKTAGPIGSGCNYEYGWTNAIVSKAFYGCDQLVSIVIPAGVTSIGSKALANCGNLSTVYLYSSIDGKNIGSGAFSSSPIADIYYPFESVSDSLKAAFPSNAVWHLSSMGSGGSGINWNMNVGTGTLVLSGNGRMDSFAESRPWDSYRTAIRKVVIENGITSIGENAFSEYQKLKSIELPLSITAVGAGAFYGCASLADVYYTDGSQVYRGKITVSEGNDPFENAAWHYMDFMADGACGDLVWIILNDGTLVLKDSDQMPDFSIDAPAPWYGYKNIITAVQMDEQIRRIGDYAFAGFSQMPRYTIPGNITELGTAIFYGSNVKELVFADSMPSISDNSLQGTTLTALYPGESYFYTNSNMLPYGGNSTWIAYYNGNPEENYYVSYDRNGGEYAPERQVKYYAADLQLCPEEARRTGYDFLGWAENADAEVAAYQPQEFISKNENVTLYALWRQKTFSIEFDANGGTGAPVNLTKQYGVELRLPTEKPVRDGYDFVGWATDQTATSALYQAGDFYTENRNIRLYAVWKIWTYTVRYDANGGSGAPGTQIKNYGETLTLSTTVPTRAGHSFQGWDTSANAVQVVYRPGSPYTANEAADLHAVWKKNTYHLNYDANGGSGAPAGITAEYQTVLQISSTVPSREYCEFAGWATDKEAETAQYQAGDTMVLEGEQTLYAVWRRMISSSGSCGNSVTWTQYADGELALTGSGTVDRYQTTKPWNTETVKKVWIGASVTDIGEGQFSDCTGLSEYVVENGSTAYSAVNGVLYSKDEKTLISCPPGKTGDVQIQTVTTSIANDAFLNCVLSSVSIPSGMKTIGDTAFCRCKNLAEIDLPDSVTSIGGGAFARCSKLATVRLPQTITIISQMMFYGCTALTDLSLPASLQTIKGSAFFDCDSLIEIQIPAAVMSIENSALSGCDNLLRVVVAPENSKYTSDDRGIVYSKDMTKLVLAPGGIAGNVDIPETVATIGETGFYLCRGLSSIHFPASVRTIERYAFSGCSALTDAYRDIPAWKSEVEALYISSNNEPLESAAWHYQENIAEGDCSDGLHWMIDQDYTLVIQGTGEMPDYSDATSPWYAYRDKIRAIILPDGLTRIGNYAFQGCTEIREINIPRSVTSIGDYAFSGCSGVANLNIPNSVTRIGIGALAGCTGLIQVKIPRSVERIENGAIEGSANLIIICDPETAALRYALENNIRYELTSNPISLSPSSGVLFPGEALQISIHYAIDSVKTYDVSYVSSNTNVAKVNNKGKVTLVSPASYGSSVSITVSAGPYSAKADYTVAGSAESIEEGVCGPGVKWRVTEDKKGLIIFGSGPMMNMNDSARCPWIKYWSTIEYVIIENGVDGIGDNAFSSIHHLKKVTIADSVKFIGEGAFQLTDLTDLYIPKGVISIGESAFSFSKLQRVQIDGPATIHKNAFAYNTDLESVKITGAVTKIETYAFRQCPNLTYIEIPPTTDFPSASTELVFIDSPNVTIYGETGSKAHHYANQFNIPFVPLYRTVFKDVSDPAMYFYKPVYWAVDNGITTGRTATTFDPYGECTRGHIVTFLWRAFGKPEPTVTSNPFGDVKTTDSFYKAVLWAYEKGITTGQTPTTFGPWKTCTRGQIVTFLWRAMGQTEPSINNPFTDVKSGDGFYKAVLWAVQNGITTGKTQTTFEPWTTCTRGQAVTFLYRAMN